MAPILPFLTDDEESMEATVRAIAEAGATHVSPIVLHLRKGGSREWWMTWLGDQRPELVPRYQELYGKGAYAPKDYQQRVSDTVHGLARRFGIGKRTGAAARRMPDPPPPPEQLSML
jgi:DNA repair photolyase